MPPIPTQDFLEIEAIKEGVIILKNKGLRSILMVSSLNFALKSEEEQNAIVYQFQNFLNSLDFSCQVVVQSRRLNMTGYLDKLDEIASKERNDLLKIQIVEYKRFIEELLGQGVIMQKSFYVVVPFTMMETRGAGLSAARKAVRTSLSEEDFRRCRGQLLQRVEFVALGLRSCGLDAVPLSNLELVELFWGLYHPLEAERGYYPEIPIELIE